MKYIRLFFVCAFLIIFSFESIGQTLTSQQVDELKKVIHQEQLDSGAPGVVFAIVQNNKIIFQEAFGVTNVTTQQPMTTETVFPIASVTKFFTALAFLKSIQANNIDVNSTVGSVIEGLSPKISSLTFHHLLAHSSGLIDGWPNNNDCESDMYEYFFNAGGDAIFADQGTVFSYSNNGYTLIGLLLSVFEDLSYIDALNKLVIEPLQLNSTTFYLEEAITHPFAAGHSEDYKTNQMKPTPTWLTIPTKQPAGGLFSNVSDLAKLAVCFMNNGNYNDEVLFSPEIIKMMSTGYTDIGAIKAFLAYPNSKYGYGTYLFERNGINYVANGGEAGNANSLFVMALEKKTAFIVLSNTGYHPFYQSIEKAMDLMFPPQKGESEYLPEESYEELIGQYYRPNIMGTKNKLVEIIYKEDELILAFSEDESYSLSHSGVNTYTYQDAAFTIPLEITFIRDDNGAIKYLNLFWRTYIKID